MLPIKPFIRPFRNHNTHARLLDYELENRKKKTLKDYSWGFLEPKDFQWLSRLERRPGVSKVVGSSPLGGPNVSLNLPNHQTRTRTHTHTNTGTTCT